VQALGEHFFPNDVAFPGAHVAQRLEQTAAGLWPEAGPAVDDVEAVPATMLKVRARMDSNDAFQNNKWPTNLTKSLSNLLPF
jgi:hypothetical protein